MHSDAAADWYPLLVVKSAVHFRADFAHRASHILDADTPGVHRPDFDNYDFRNLRRPIYPLDPHARFPPRADLSGTTV